MEEEFLLVLEEAFFRQLPIYLTVSPIIFCKDDPTGTYNVPTRHFTGYVTNITETGFVMINFIIDNSAKTISHVKNAFSFHEILRLCNNFQYNESERDLISNYLATCKMVQREIDESEVSTDLYDITELFGYKTNPEFKAVITKKALKSLKKNSKEKLE